MGLDAYVRCTCFDEGKTTPFERPDLLGVGEDGEFGLLVPWEDHKELFDRYWEWRQTACEHPDMDVASERISNWAGYREFQEALGRLGWDSFPTLRDELPEGNGGAMFPISATKALGELDLFEREQVGSEKTVLVDSDSGELQHTYIACSRGVFLFAGSKGLDAGFDPAGFFLRRREEDGDAELFRAMRVEVTGTQIVDRDLGTSFPFDVGWGTGRRFHVEQRITTRGEFDYILRPLRTVFRASVATGNPVIWC
jgi:hypothetical protein